MARIPLAPTLQKHPQCHANQVPHHRGRQVQKVDCRHAAGRTSLSLAMPCLDSNQWGQTLRQASPELLHIFFNFPDVPQSDPRPAMQIGSSRQPLPTRVRLGSQDLDITPAWPACPTTCSVGALASSRTASPHAPVMSKSQHARHVRKMASLILAKARYCLTCYINGSLCYATGNGRGAFPAYRTVTQTHAQGINPRFVRTPLRACTLRLRGTRLLRRLVNSPSPQPPSRLYAVSRRDLHLFPTCITREKSRAITGDLQTTGVRPGPAMPSPPRPYPNRAVTLLCDSRVGSKGPVPQLLHIGQFDGY
jgi:hypothetical protein